MRTLNIVAMALVMSLVVILAFAAKHAQSAEPPRVWLRDLEQPLRSLIVYRHKNGMIEEAAKFTELEGAISLTRLPGEAMPDERAVAALDKIAFLAEATRRFEAAVGDGTTLTAVPLTPRGRLVGGFVTRISAADGYCDFGVASYAADAERRDTRALARIVVCAPTAGMTPPDVRLAGLLALSDAAR